MHYQLRLTIVSWLHKDNFGLFDHEDKKHTKEQPMRVRESSVLTRISNSLDIGKKNSGRQPAGSPLLELILDEGKGWLRVDSYQVCVLSDKTDCLHRLILPDTSTDFTRLRQGDVLKLGLVIVKVIRLYKPGTSRQQQTLHYTASTLELSGVHEVERIRSVTSSGFASMEVNDQPCCRYCLKHSSSKDNPIINCCACKGHTRFVHLRCLDIWLRDRMAVCSAREVIGFSKKGVQCELCLSYFDFRVVLQLRYQRIITAFCVIEHSLDKDYVYILNLTDTPEFVLGRGRNSDLSLNDDTISRSHCKIHFDQYKGHFYISDTNSKFGTLMQLKEHKFRGSVTLQLDRHVISIQQLEKTNFFQRMFGFCKPYHLEEEEDDRQATTPQKYQHEVRQRPALEERE